MAEWYEEIFDSDYLIAYQRFTEISKEEVAGLIDLLSITKEMKILDLCCGYGRHSLELARQGYNVTGYDLSNFFLEDARKKAKKEKLQVDFVPGDVRELDFTEKFDIVFNMLTSFGYFEDEENEDVLSRIARSLVPGGRFLIQAICFTGALCRISPEREYFVTEEKGVTIVDKNSWDLEKNILKAKRILFFEDGRKREYSFSFRVYTLAEMLKMLDKAGLQLIDYYENLQGDPYTQNSFHYTIISEKIP